MGKFEATAGPHLGKTCDGPVKQQVSALPEAQRNAVFLVYVEGFTYQEAADTLSVPIGTVMSRLAAARSTLAKTLSPAPSAREKRL